MPRTIIIIVISLVFITFVQTKLILPELETQSSLQIIREPSSSVEHLTSSYLLEQSSKVNTKNVFILQSNLSLILLSNDWKSGNELVVFYFYQTFASFKSALHASTINAPFNHRLLWYIFVSQENSLQFGSEWNKFNWGHYYPAFMAISVIYNEPGHSTEVLWSVHCAICLQNDQKGTIVHGSVEVPSPQAVINFRKQLGKKGYGNPTSLTQFSLWVGNRSTNFYRSRESGALVEPRNYSHNPLHILFGILSIVLNFTIEPTQTPPPPFSSLIGCIYCSVYTRPSKPQLSTSIYLVPIDVDHFNLIYCKPKVEFDTRNSMEFILSPFKPFVWICFLLFCLVFGLLVEKSIFAILDPIWAFLGQPRSASSLLASACILLFIILQTYYLSIFTANVIRPFPQSQIETNLELLNNGFRLLELYTGEKKQTYQYQFQRLHLEIDKKYFVEPINCTPPILCLTTMEFVTTAGPNKFKRFGLLDLAKRSSKSCHVVKESWSSQWSTYYFYSHLAERAYEVLTSLKSGGFHTFWIKFYDTAVARNASKMELQVSKSSSGVNAEVYRISMSSKFSDVFYLTVISIWFQSLFLCLRCYFIFNSFMNCFLI